MYRTMIALGLAVSVPLAPANAEDAEEASDVGEAEAVIAARANLLNVIGEYTPGAPITSELTERVSTAAAELEEAAGDPPNLWQEFDRVTGQWALLFSSQGVVGEIPVQFMTRSHPGGGIEGGTAKSLTVLQELRPADRFYRNMMVMEAGEDATPLLHIATADLGISADKPNDLTVSFRVIGFAPGRADVTPEQLREALSLPEGADLSVDMPLGIVSKSTVTYLDDDLRINRGKDYIAVLRKVY